MLVKEAFSLYRLGEFDMAKRRERRAPPSSDRREEGIEASKRTIRRGGDSASSPQISIVLFLFVVITPAIAVLVYRTKYSPRANRVLSSYVHQQGLVKADVNYQEILTENSKVSKNMSQRHYTYPVLAYITPWNNKGYDIAKSFNWKFTHISPVWYDLKSQGTNLVLEGRHNADRGWISELRIKGNALVLPRVVLEAFPKELLSKKKQRDKAIDMIITECKEIDYDGIVLESWSRWAAYGILHDPDMRNLALQFIKQLGQALHSVSLERNGKQGLQLIYVIGPPRSENLQEHDFGPADLRSLSDYVDGFSLMTYDFSGPQNPGPNAPLKWIHFTLQVLLGSKSDQNLAQKILLGINFYGNDFALSRGGGGGAITGRDYLSLLDKHKPVMQWEKESGEHLFFYSDDRHVKHAVFYPSLMSIFLRLEEVRSWGVGISIWEIGQGLDYFFDLL